jgi:hypothetical protein
MSAWPGRRCVMVLLVNRPNRHVDALSLYAFWVICVATSVLAPV